MYIYIYHIYIIYISYIYVYISYIYIHTYIYIIIYRQGQNRACCTCTSCVAFWDQGARRRCQKTRLTSATGSGNGLYHDIPWYNPSKSFKILKWINLGKIWKNDDWWLVEWGFPTVSDKPIWHSTAVSVRPPAASSHHRNLQVPQKNSWNSTGTVATVTGAPAKVVCWISWSHA